MFFDFKSVGYSEDKAGSYDCLEITQCEEPFAVEMIYADPNHGHRVM